MRFAAFTAMDFAPASPGERAGLVLLNGANQIRLEVGQGVIRLVRAEEVLAEAFCEAGRVKLAVEGDGQDYRFRVNDKALGAVVDGSLLRQDGAGTFTGAYLGLYATSNGLPSTTVASFPYFEYVAAE
jgi:alpha-N-arabinofuranosidase